MNNIKLNKTKKYWLISLIFLVFLAGCEGFLETPPLDVYSDGAFYTTPATAELAVNSVYNVLISDFAVRYLEENGGPLERGALLYPYYAEGAYKACFVGIADANIVLKYVPDIDFGNEEVKKNRLLAEATALRAYYYYILSVYLGPVMKITEPLTYEEVTNIKRPEDVDEIRTFIKSELEASIADLPSKSDTENGRVSKDFARFVLAQEYLVEENWVEAEKYLSQIIETNDYSLLPDFNDIASYDTQGSVCNDWEYTDESIFEVSFIEGMEDFDSDWFDQMTPVDCSGYQYRSERETMAKDYYQRTFLLGSSIDTYTATENENWVNRATGDMVNTVVGDVVNKPVFYEDPRRKSTILKYGDQMICVAQPEVYQTLTNSRYDNYAGNFLFAKYWPTSNVVYAGERGRNYLLMRYAQVLLNYAEVQYRLGHTDVAYQYLNMVRKRAWAGHIESEWKRPDSNNLYPNSNWNILVAQPLLAKGYDKFFVDLINEYFLEFTFEGKTSELMMRWGNRSDIAEAFGYQPEQILPNRIFYGWPIEEVEEHQDNIWQNQGF